MVILNSDLWSLQKDDGAPKQQFQLDSGNVSKLTNTQSSASDYSLLRAISRLLAEMVQSHVLLQPGIQIRPTTSHFTETDNK